MKRMIMASVLASFWILTACGGVVETNTAEEQTLTTYNGGPFMPAEGRYDMEYQRMPTQPEQCDLGEVFYAYNFLTHTGPNEYQVDYYFEFVPGVPSYGGTDNFTLLGRKEVNLNPWPSPLIVDASDWGVDAKLVQYMPVTPCVWTNDTTLSCLNNGQKFECEGTDEACAQLADMFGILSGLPCWFAPAQTIYTLTE